MPNHGSGNRLLAFRWNGDQLIFAHLDITVRFRHPTDANTVDLAPFRSKRAAQLDDSPPPVFMIANPDVISVLEEWYRIAICGWSGFLLRHDPILFTKAFA